LINSNHDKITIDPLILTQGVELSEVTVTTKKPFIEMKADQIIVNVETSTVNSGNSAIEILQKSPGVMIDKDNNISLRGKQGVLVMING
jgi:iron complex outermembrane receptor protein